jgi:hypothetical protein
MWYLGGGIGYKNQTVRWTFLRGNEINDNTMDVDPPAEDDKISVKHKKFTSWQSNWVLGWQATVMMKILT